MSSRATCGIGIAVFLYLQLVLLHGPLFAGSATWNEGPSGGDWNTSSNWTPNTVPNGSTDEATFGFSTIPTIFVSSATEVKNVVFSLHASAYTITALQGIVLSISGTGII